MDAIGAMDTKAMDVIDAMDAMAMDAMAMDAMTMDAMAMDAMYLPGLRPFHRGSRKKRRVIVRKCPRSLAVKVCRAEGPAQIGRRTLTFTHVSTVIGGENVAYARPSADRAYRVRAQNAYIYIRVHGHRR